jgi:hypothetical protein
MANHPEHQLHVIFDADGKKQAEKLYDRYIRQEDENYARHPEFLIALDRLLMSFSARPAQEEPDTAEDEDADGNALEDFGEQDYEPDEDIHERPPEMSSRQKRLQAAIASVINKR